MEKKEDLKKLELKVSVDCDGCKKKVKKMLQSIDGVLETTVDMSLSKVTVVGNVDAETLIKKLVKHGKPAERWPETVKKEKKEGNESKKEKKSDGAGGGSGSGGATQKSGGGSGGATQKSDNSDTNGGGSGKKGGKKGGGNKANENIDDSNNSGEGGKTNPGNGDEIQSDSNPTPPPQVNLTIHPGIVHHPSHVMANEAPPYYYPTQGPYPPYYHPSQGPHPPHYYRPQENHPPARPPGTGTSWFDNGYYSDEDTIGCSIM